MKKELILTLIASFCFAYGVGAQTWDERPVYAMKTVYEQDFTTKQWDGDLFYGQWDAIMPNIFSASDIENGYLQFEWIEKRILHSKEIYEAPFILEADLSYADGSNSGGIVMRVDLSGEEVQEPHHGDPGFNSEGIAFYPTDDGDSLIVQFSGPFVFHNTPVSRIMVPKPDELTSLKEKNSFRIEDYDSSIYVFLNEAPFIRIELGDKSGANYTSGTVYDSSMEIKGSFENMEVQDKGKVSICQRTATLRLHTLSIQKIDLKEQSIGFNRVGVKTIDDDPFRIEASASSGLPVSLSLVSGPAELVNDTVKLTGEAGVVNILLGQAGNNEYLPVSLNYTFYVSKQYSENSGVPVTGLLICCRGNGRGPFLINGEWKTSHNYKDINQVRGILSQVQNAGINVVCVDLTNPSQWTRLWDDFEPMVENVRTACAEKNMEYFIMIGAVVSDAVRAEEGMPEYIKTVGHLEFWNNQAKYIWENWAQDDHYRTYGFGDERKIINMFYPGELVFGAYGNGGLWASTPDEHKTYLSKFYRGTHEYNQDFRDTPTDGWGYRDVQQSSDGKIRFVCPTSGLAPSSATHISAQQWSDRIDWAAEADHYSIYGSYDDNNDNIHWGITNTANNSAPEMRYPGDDPYYYYDILKNKLTSGPGVSFITPKNNDTFGKEDHIEVEVSAFDSDSISHVELFINSALVGSDSTAPYRWGQADSLQRKLVGGRNTLEAVASDTRGISTKASIIITWDSDVGISRNSSGTNQNLIRVYPNPSNEVLNISCSELVFENAELTVHNTSGVSLLSQQISGKQSSLDIARLSSGMYLLRIVHHENVYQEKIIKY